MRLVSDKKKVISVTSDGHVNVILSSAFADHSGLVSNQNQQLITVCDVEKPLFHRALRDLLAGVFRESRSAACPFVSRQSQDDIQAEELSGSEFTLF